jgi:hypothetical protein
MTQGVFDRSTAERNAAIIRHWKFGLTQTGIGRLMGISRSIVAGVLTRAREDGLIGRLELEDAARRKANWANAHEKRQLVQGGRQAFPGGLRTAAFQSAPGSLGFKFTASQGSGPASVSARICYAVAGAAERQRNLTQRSLRGKNGTAVLPN